MDKLMPKNYGYYPKERVGIYRISDIPTGMRRSLAINPEELDSQPMLADRVNGVVERPGITANEGDSLILGHYYAAVRDQEWADRGYVLVEKVSRESSFERFSRVQRFDQQRIYTKVNLPPEVHAPAPYRLAKGPIEASGLSKEDYEAGRQEWSDRLRKLQHEAREKERLRVLVDIQDL